MPIVNSIIPGVCDLIRLGLSTTILYIKGLGTAREINSLGLSV